MSMMLKSPLKVLKFTCCMSQNLKIYFLFITYTIVLPVVNEGLYTIN